MNDHKKNIILSIAMAVLLSGLSLVNLIHPDAKYSDSERRILAQKPAFSKSTLLSGQYMKEFESYAQDQFVFKDSFRSVKAICELTLFQKKEFHDLYYKEGYLVKIEYPFQPKMQDHVVERFTYLYETYLKPNNITPYFAIIPDKNYFLGSKYDYLTLNYEDFEKSLTARLPFMNIINIKDFLSIDDYYKTDTHWKQENLFDVADHIASSMHANIESSYHVETLAFPFYGVYYNQMALPTKPDELKFITNDTIHTCIVTNFDTGRPVSSSVYNMKNATGKDPYEMFLDGSCALLTIENPAANSDRQLILFRDSFGSSIAPYFIPGYQKITLVDIRYVQSSMLSNFIDFENADVLFLYSTLLLNNSLSLK